MSTIKVVLLSLVIGVMAGAAAALSVIAWVPSLFPSSETGVAGGRLVNGFLTGRAATEEISPEVWNTVHNTRVLFYAPQTKKTTLGITVKAFPAREYVGAGVFVTSDGWLVAPRSLGARAKELVLVGDHKELRVVRVVQDAMSGVAFIKVEGDNFSVMPFASAATWLGEPWWVDGAQPVRVETPLWHGSDTAARRAGGFDADTVVRWPGFETSNPPVLGTAVVNVRGELVGITDVVQGRVHVVPLALVTPLFTKVFLSQPVERSEAQFSYAMLNDWELVDVTAYLKKLSGGALVRTVERTVEEGIQPGDIIRSIEDIEVRDGRDLGLILATFKDRDRVSARIVREGKEETATIEFVKPVDAVR